MRHEPGSRRLLLARPVLTAMPDLSATDPPWLQHLIEDLDHPDPVWAFVARTHLRLIEQHRAAEAAARKPPPC